MKFRQYLSRGDQLNNLSQWSRSWRTTQRSHMLAASLVKSRAYIWSMAYVFRYPNGWLPPVGH